MEITLRVSGMDCAACAPRLQRRLEAVAGVERVMVNYAASRCKIEYGGERADYAALYAAVRRAGFDVPPETAEIECAAFDREAAKAALGALDGVRRVEDTGDGKLRAVLWTGVESKTLLAALRAHGIYAAVTGRTGGDEEIQLHSRMALLRALCVSVLFTMPLVWDLHPYVQLALASVVQFGPGRYFYRGAWRSLRAGSLGMDVLIAASTSIIYIYSAVVTFTVTVDIQLYFLSECVLLSFILFGKYLETLSKNEASGAIRQLMRLRPNTATVVRGAEEREVDIDEITEHDILRVRPGERISVDGTVLEGACTVDESMLTGESAPVEKTVGDTVYAGTLDRSGSILMSAEGIGRDSVLEQIIATVERAQCSKAPIERFADRIAGVFIPVIAAAALGVFALWFLRIAPGDWGKAVYALCAVLVISCPCALGLATPTAIMTGSGRAAELGILFRDGEQLEKACRADTVVFDKTGTLTYGEPEAAELIGISGDLEEALIYAAAVERLSEHPAARAVVRCAGARCMNALPFSVTDFESIRGAGAAGTVQGHSVLCGTRELISARGVDIRALDGVEDVRGRAHTEVVIAIDGTVRAVLGIADRLRPEARETVAALRAMGIDVWMMTGDNEKTARAIGAEAGIVNIISGVKPDGKAEAIRDMQARGARVCMVGDGINDAPALATADVSISVSTETDVAAEASGIVLIGGEVRGVPLALRLSRQTMRVIRQNLIWALFYNVVCIPVAAAGLINPSIAAAAMSLSSNGVLFNSLRLKNMEVRHEK